MKLIVVGAVMASLLSATPALADWRFTRWGMSPEEVRAAGGDQVVPVSKRKPLPLAIKEPFEIGRSKFSAAEFHFDNNKLARVILRGEGTSQSELREALSASFGQGAAREREPITGISTEVYRDKEKGNAITLLCVMGCSLVYSPLDQGF